MPQKLSAKARAAKKKRDLDYANSLEGKKKRRECQKARRAAIKKHGRAWLNGKDYDHKTGRFTSVKKNRGNSGKGTKKESKKRK